MRTPPEPALCARAEHVIVPVQRLTLSFDDLAGFIGLCQVSGERRRLDGRGISSRSSRRALFDGVHVRMVAYRVGRVAFALIL